MMVDNNIVLKRAIKIIDTKEPNNIMKKLTYSHVVALRAKIAELEKVNDEYKKLHEMTPTITHLTKAVLEEEAERSKKWQQETIELMQENNDIKKTLNKALDKIKELKEENKKLLDSF
ncbi:hypothetical protein [Niallia taxi]|uniref:hypothetical protein n=1 Tax=Niallia taxi TaxID=2499688 RepID=UPI00300AA13D